jgi:acyl dehydratase
MPINYEKLINWPIPEIRQQFTKRDTILYALGVGLGADPCDKDQLRFVYEKELVALPTMAIVLGYPGPWHAHPDTGITRSKVVQGEIAFTIHRPLPVKGNFVGTNKVVNVVDKGKDRGALLVTECAVRDERSGDALCTWRSTLFCRADGGFGGPTGPAPALHPTPTTAPQHTCDLPTLPQAALIYRLSGDYNPLHADPISARQSGFERPILHGRCTLGIVGHALLKTCCAYDPARLRSMEGRLSAPVYPGESIRTEIWRDGDVVAFRATVPAREVTVVSHGRATIDA